MNRRLTVDIYAQSQVFAPGFWAFFFSAKRGNQAVFLVHKGPQVSQT